MPGLGQAARTRRTRHGHRRTRPQNHCFRLRLPAIHMDTVTDTVQRRFQKVMPGLGQAARTRRTWHGHGRTRPQWFKSLIASSRAAPWEAMLLVKEAKQAQLEPGVKNILPAHPSPLPPACPEWRDSCNSKVQIRPNCNYYLGQPDSDKLRLVVTIRF